MGMTRLQLKALLLGIMAAPAALLAGNDTGTQQATGPAKPGLKPIEDGIRQLGRGANAAGTQLYDGVLRMQEFFGVTLPGMAARHRLVLDFEPKLGDLARREFVRFPVDVRYAFGQRWEAFGGLTPVSPNPFDSGNDHKWSLGMAKLGLRADVPCEKFFLKKLNVGFEALQPLGNPPVDLIDGYLHLRPFVTATRQLSFVPDTTLIVGLLYDHAADAPGHDDVPAETRRRHMWELAPGVLYKPGELGYFAQYALRDWDEPDGHRLEHLARAGVVWDVPRSRSERWGLPGKWQLELGAKVSLIEGEAVNPGIHARAKVSKDWLRRRKPLALWQP